MCEQCSPQPQSVIQITTGHVAIWPSRCRHDCRCVTCRPDILRLNTAGANYAPVIIPWPNTAGANT